MLQFQNDRSASVLAVKATHELSQADCHEFVARLGQVVQRHLHPRVLIELQNVRGCTPGAGWEDPTFCLQYKHDIRRVALIGTPQERDWLKKLADCFVNVKTFRRGERKKALAWLTEETDSDREEIRRLAYDKWVAAGRPHGHDVDHWLEAERELLVSR